MEWLCRCMKHSIAGHCTAQTWSFACLFGCSLLSRPFRLGSQRVGSPCSVVSLSIYLSVYLSIYLSIYYYYHHLALTEWLLFYTARLFVTKLFGCYMAGATWKCCLLGASFVYSIQPCTSLQCHFIRRHIRKLHVCLVVTSHRHFWQNDRDLLRATAVTRGGTDTKIKVITKSWLWRK